MQPKFKLNQSVQVLGYNFREALTGKVTGVHVYSYIGMDDLEKTQIYYKVEYRDFPEDDFFAEDFYFEEELE